MKLTIQSQVSLLELVKPPVGFELVCCIGTSYSLNLECLLQLGLTSRNVSITKESVSPQEAFEIVGDISHRFIFFCNSCRIKDVAEHEVALMHPEYKRFWSLLDEVVKVVHPLRPKTCFHPKVTVMKFKAQEGDEIIYKLIVASRNLTLDLSWDVAASFVGVPGKKPGKNPQLIGFIDYLLRSSKGSVSKEQLRKIHSVMADLERIDFKSPFGNKIFNFDYQSFEGQKFNFALRDFRKLVAISPFVSTSSVVDLGNKLDEFMLVTSVEGRATIGDTALPKGMGAFVFREDDIGLHSKLYVGQYSDGKCKVILGSANLTSNGLATGNVEAVACMDVPNSFYSEFVENFIYQRQDGARVLAPWLEEFSSANKQDEEELATTVAEQIQDYLSSGTFKIEYALKAKIAKLRFQERTPLKIKDGYTVQIRMLGADKPLKFSEVNSPAGATYVTPLSELTRLLYVEIRFKSAIVSSFMTIAEGEIPTRNRSRAMAKAVIKSWDDLLSYLSSVLGDDPDSALVSKGAADGTSKSKAKKLRPSVPPAILERILIGCQDDDMIIERIDVALSAIAEVERGDKQYETFQLFWKELKTAIYRMRRAA